MKSRKELAELAALLAQRSTARDTAAARHYTPARIAADALKLARYASAAQSSAVNLCNITDYQTRFDRKKESIRKGAQDVCGAYNLRAQCSGDPRGYCLRLFATDATNIPGNTWGGDDDGYAI